jgi:hypothetical protein
VKRGAVVTASIGGDSAKPRPFLVLRSDQFSILPIIRWSRSDQLPKTASSEPLKR